MDITAHTKLLSARKKEYIDAELNRRKEAEEKKAKGGKDHASGTVSMVFGSANEYS